MLQEIQAVPLENENLKHLTRRRRALVDERSRVIARLKADLKTVCPDLMAIAKEAKSAKRNLTPQFDPAIFLTPQFLTPLISMEQ